MNWTESSEDWIGRRAEWYVSGCLICCLQLDMPPVLNYFTLVGLLKILLSRHRSVHFTKELRYLLIVYEIYAD